MQPLFDRSCFWMRKYFRQLLVFATVSLCLGLILPRDLEAWWCRDVIYRLATDYFAMREAQKYEPKRLRRVSSVEANEASFDRAYADLTHRIQELEARRGQPDVSPHQLHGWVEAASRMLAIVGTDHEVWVEFGTIPFIKILPDKSSLWGKAARLASDLNSEIHLRPDMIQNSDCCALAGKEIDVNGSQLVLPWTSIRATLLEELRHNALARFRTSLPKDFPYRGHTFLRGRAFAHEEVYVKKMAILDQGERLRSFHNQDELERVLPRLEEFWSLSAESRRGRSLFAEIENMGLARAAMEWNELYDAVTHLERDASLMGDAMESWRHHLATGGDIEFRREGRYFKAIANISRQSKEKIFPSEIFFTADARDLPSLRRRLSAEIDRLSALQGRDLALADEFLADLKSGHWPRPALFKRLNTQPDVLFGLKILF